MSDNKIKKTLKVTGKKKKTISLEEVFVEKVIEVDGFNRLSYIVFCYKEIEVLYGLSTDSVNLLIYLKELWIFPYNIYIIDDVLNLSTLLSGRFVREDYSLNNRKMFKMSDKGTEVIKKFNDLIARSDIYISKNRVSDIGLSNRMDDILARANQ